MLAKFETTKPVSSRGLAPRSRPIFGMVATLLLMGCGGGGASSAGPVVFVDEPPVLVDWSSRVNPVIRLYQDDFGDSGTVTPNTNADPLHYETSEYQASGTLAAGKFSDAYARGWTGLGSLVTFADTGIDETHLDLAANIASTRDFVGDDVNDTHGHGTHVAGIVAAVRNGSGVHGAAFDAKLAIAKVASSSSYDFELARQATIWGRDQGSVAVNVSAAYLLDPNLHGRLVKISEGSYYLDHPTYDENGFYGVKSLGSSWQSALGTGQVLVKAAGNNNTSYSAGLNQLATATNDDGELMLNGQMLIVGNWDTANSVIRGNQAGNVCTSWVDGNCLDAARIQDSFLLAPGTNIVSTYPGDNYAAMTGTSMAAPVAAAAIAVLHQMWPHLDGAQLASLLLVTADKSIPGYAQHVHGQGLLDLENATRPVGDLGLPQSAAVEGVKMALSGGGAMTNLASSARLALSGVMLLDDYQRDFYVDLGASISNVDTRKTSATEAGGLVDGYAAYFGEEKKAAFRTMLSPSVSLISGAGREEGEFLGQRISGVLGHLGVSTTAYSLLNVSRRVNDNGVQLFGQLGGGITHLDFADRPSLLQDADTVISKTATLGMMKSFGVANEAGQIQSGGSFGAIISRPVQIQSGNLSYNLPVARDINGRVAFDQRDVSLRPDKYETDLGLFYRRTALGGALRAETYIELRYNAAGTPVDDNRPVHGGGVRVQFRF